MIIDQLFGNIKLNATGVAKAEYIAEVFSVLLYALENTCPTNGREFSIVRTKLEEASFYAKKSISKYEPNTAF